MQLSGSVLVPLRPQEIMNRIISTSYNATAWGAIRQTDYALNLIKPRQIWSRIVGTRVDILVTEPGEPPTPFTPPALRIRIQPAGNGSLLVFSHTALRVIAVLRILCVAIVVIGFLSIGVVPFTPLEPKPVVIGCICAALCVVLLLGGGLVLALGQLAALQLSFVRPWLVRILGDVANDLVGTDAAHSKDKHVQPE